LLSFYGGYETELIGIQLVQSSHVLAATPELNTTSPHAPGASLPPGTLHRLRK